MLSNILLKLLYSLILTGWCFGCLFDSCWFYELPLGWIVVGMNDHKVEIYN